MILKIFSPKISAKKLAFLTRNKAKLCKILIITLIFDKNANFVAENSQKSQKIVIITSVPDELVKKVFFFLVEIRKVSPPL
jgi:predicted dinucleotide-binding enzyme